MNDYYKAVDGMDFDAFISQWSEDAEFRVPWNPALDSVGREAIEARFSATFAALEDVEATWTAQAIAGAPQALARTSIKMTFRNGLIYENTLLAVFTFNHDGQIRRMEEWINLDAYWAAFEGETEN